MFVNLFFFFSSRRRHTRWTGDWSSDVCSSDLSCAADHGYASGAVDPKRFSRDVGTKRKGVAANAGWIARRNIEHTVRSEERRVGKECRSRWAAYEKKKKDENGGWGSNVSGELR